MNKSRKTILGQVVSDKMDKTVVVAVERYRTHRLYKRRIRRITKFKAHDYNNSCKLGDTVRIEETKPLSREKRWRVIEVLARIDIADTQPDELAGMTEGAKK
jgi:small subunit ribosomal protein S17